MPNDNEVDVQSFLKNIKTENEQKLVCYFMHNPKETLGFDEKFFLHGASKAIFRGVREIAERELHFDLDTLLVLAQRDFKPTTFELIDGIFNKFDNFQNVDFVKDTLRDDYFKFNLKTRIFKELWPKAIQADSLSVEDVRRFAESLIVDISESNGTRVFLTTEELVDTHKKVIEDRDYGVVQRTMGFAKLDKALTRPAAPEEITLIAAQKGAGKSIFLKTIENMLINRGVCVISLNLEMSQASNMDRLLCIRNGYTLPDLNQQNMDPEFKRRVMSNLDEIRSIKNFVYSPESTMAPARLRSAIKMGKLILKQNGVLPKDEYVVVAIDSLDMFEGFNDPSDIKKNIDIVAKAIRDENAHCIALVQLNEDKIRGQRFSDPDDIDKIRFTYFDIYGGSYYAARARTVITLNRPKQLRIQLFPEFEEKWRHENDVLQAVISKQNDGAVSGFLNFAFDGPGVRITQMAER